MAASATPDSTTSCVTSPLYADYALYVLGGWISAIAVARDALASEENQKRIVTGGSKGVGGSAVTLGPLPLVAIYVKGYALCPFCFGNFV
jgi:hypothetical protein